jgi:hypothetical protein
VTGCWQVSEGPKADIALQISTYLFKGFLTCLDNYRSDKQEAALRHSSDLFPSPSLWALLGIVVFPLMGLPTGRLSVSYSVTRVTQRWPRLPLE